MKKPSFPVRIAILMAILCIPPIGATQIGWYYFGQTMGVNFGMAAGVVSVITAAYLMYQWVGEMTMMMIIPIRIMFSL